jgi:5'-phosphate synthase pdxT subunit
MKTVGVLALQGDFEAHRKAIEKAGANAREVRTASQLEPCDGLIIPGGESTTMLKLLEMEKLTERLRQFAAAKPVFGTCAGAILLAHSVSNPGQESLNILDIDVERNAYGRQVDSRVARVETSDGEIEAVFIRAPIIRRTGPRTRVLATYLGDPVWIEQGMHMATTFHPELSDTSAVHRRFVERL